MTGQWARGIGHWASGLRVRSLDCDCAFMLGPKPTTAAAAAEAGRMGEKEGDLERTDENHPQRAIYDG